MGFTISTHVIALLLISGLQITQGAKRKYFKYGGNWKSLRDQPPAIDEYASSWSKNRPAVFGGRQYLEDSQIQTDTRDVPENSEVDLSCSVDRYHYPRIRWSRLGQQLPYHAREIDNRLYFRNIQMTDAGTYVCTASNDWDTKEVHVKLTVQLDTPARNQVGRPIGQCRIDQAVCRTGECIDRAGICDGEVDCSDGSDEQGCGRGNRNERAQIDFPLDCEPNEFKCDNGQCKLLYWWCDGDDDCGDNSDEQTCGRRLPGDPCEPWEYQCGSQQQCIHKAFWCDKRNDCFDGSDEVGCTGPTVVEPPVQFVNANCGETIVLYCKTIGVPDPYVNWRLNWGHVCRPPRCTQTSEKGQGTFTITNAQESDSGAYTCEAINVGGRILYSPDTIVTVTCGPRPEPTTPAPRQILQVWVDPPFQELDEGTTVRFQCHVGQGSGGPYTYSWIRIGSEALPQNARVEGDTLIIDDAHIQDYGTYQCTVTSQFGDSGSATGELKVRRVGTCPYVWIEPITIWNPPAGSTKEFVCKAIGEPTPTLTWSWADLRPLDSNIQDHGDGRLTVSNIGRHQCGVLMCTAVNRAGKNTATLQVCPGGSTVTTPPIVVVVDPKIVTSKLHETVEVRCTAYGDGTFTYKWERVDGQQMANNAQDLGNGVLRFLRIESINVGEYRCTARSNGQSGTDTTRVLEPQGDVTPPRPPLVYVNPPLIEEPAGSNSQFECVAHGDPRDPPPTLTWKTRDGRPMPHDVQVSGHILRFPNLQDHHIGHYTCEASTPLAKAEAFGEVRISRGRGIPPSTPTVTPPYTITSIGDRVMIRCESYGVPPPALRWGCGTADTPLRPGITLTNDGSTMIVESVQDSDAGSCFCTATNEYGRAVSPPAVIEIRRPEPPPEMRVWIEPQDYWTGRPGDGFEFICKSDAQPPPQFSWRRQDGRSLGNNVQEAGGGRLRLTGVASTDAGQYVCDAVGPAGHGSAIATVAIEDAPVVVTVSPEHQEAEDGEPVTFTCTATGYPPPTLTWGFQNDRGPLRPGIRHEDGRLTIDRVRQEDAGRYVCTATTPRGPVSDDGVLVVKGGGGPPPVPEVTPKFQTLPEGERAEFQCSVESDSQVTLSWAFGSPTGTLPPRVREEDDGRSIVIDSIQEIDEGQYFCIATNNFGSNSAPGQLFVDPPPTPPERPKVTVTPKENKGKPSDEIIIQCTATGYPEPEIRWERQGGADMESNVQKDEKDNSLIIGDARISNTGTYVCIATNSAGEDSDTATVDIAAQGPTVDVCETVSGKCYPGPNVIYTICEGAPLDLRCKVGGDPTPSLEISLDKGPERGDVPEGYKPIEIYNEFIRHDSFSRANEGSAKCKATNEHGTAEVTIRFVKSECKGHVVILGGNERPTAVGSRLELRCLMTDPNTKYRVHWARTAPEGQPMPSHETPTEGTLAIPNFSADAAGTYQCQAMDIDSNAVKSTADVSVSVLGQHDQMTVVDVEGPKIRAVTAGETLELQCVAPTESPDNIRSELRWQILDKGTFRPLERGSVVEGRLVINDVKMEDAGIYSCARFLGDTRDGANQVTVLVSNTETSAKITLAEVGQTVDLVCPLYHVSGMTYRWKRVNQPRLPSGAQSEGQRLLINRFKQDFTGTYECEGRLNGARARGYVQAALGGPRLAAIIQPIRASPYNNQREYNYYKASPTQSTNRPILSKHPFKIPAVVPTSKPYIDLSLDVTPDFVFAGHDVMFRCKVNGDPTARIRWEKADGTLPHNAYTNREVLKIRKVQKSDVGRYICHATTKIGDMSAYTVLKLGQKVSGNVQRRYYRLRT